MHSLNPPAGQPNYRLVPNQLFPSGRWEVERNGKAMGFLSSLAAEWANGSARGRAIGQTQNLRVVADVFYSDLARKNPAYEPYQILALLWPELVTFYGEPVLAGVAEYFARLYACLPPPTCSQMLALNAAFFTVRNFSQTEWADHFSSGVSELLQHADLCDAHWLNDRFKRYNPRAYEAIIACTGLPPFDAETMREASEMSDRVRRNSPPDGW